VAQAILWLASERASFVTGSLSIWPAVSRRWSAGASWRHICCPHRGMLDSSWKGVYSLASN
jgi:hypothetical protein